MRFHKWDYYKGLAERAETRQIDEIRTMLVERIKRQALNGYTHLTWYGGIPLPVLNEMANAGISVTRFDHHHMISWE